MTPNHSRGRSAGIVVVGDAIVDIVEDPLGNRYRCPGGAGLNLAVAVRQRGMAAVLAAPLPPDEPGSWLRQVLFAEGATLVPLASSGPTGTATSRRVAGEPEYEFSSSVYHRHYAYSPCDVSAMSAGNVLVVNSFPMHDHAQDDALVEVVRRTGHTFVVDPNARPTLMVQPRQYRDGFRRLARAAHVVKLSRQDIADMEAKPPERVVDELLELGVGAVVFTKAAAGASVRTANGISVSVPASSRPEPVVDTMGAGDAALGSLVCGIAQHGRDLTADQWGGLLTLAMDAAADICRIEGGSFAAARNRMACT